MVGRRPRSQGCDRHSPAFWRWLSRFHPQQSTISSSQCGRAGISSAGFGAAAPLQGIETGSLASIRTLLGQFHCFGPVHDLILVSCLRGVGRCYLVGAPGPLRSRCCRSNAVAPNLRNCFIPWVVPMSGSGDRRPHHRHVVQIAFPKREQQDREFPGDGNNIFFLRRAASPIGQGQAVASQVAVRSERT